MTTDKTSSGSDQTPSKPSKTRTKRKLKAGRRTARTSGMSQSAFAGYATPPAPTPAPTKPATAEREGEEKEDTEKGAK